MNLTECIQYSNAKLISNSNYETHCTPGVEGNESYLKFALDTMRCSFVFSFYLVRDQRPKLSYFPVIETQLLIQSENYKYKRGN